MVRYLWDPWHVEGGAGCSEKHRAHKIQPLPGTITCAGERTVCVCMEASTHVRLSLHSWLNPVLWREYGSSNKSYRSSEEPQALQAKD